MKREPWEASVTSEPKQIELPIRLSVEEQIRARLSRSMVCQHYSARDGQPTRISRETCLERQMATDKSGAPRFRHCALGDCAEGLVVALEAGLVVRRQCECCQGRGWIPEQVEAPMSVRARR